MIDKNKNLETLKKSEEKSKKILEKLYLSQIKKQKKQGNNRQESN